MNQIVNPIVGTTIESDIHYRAFMGSAPQPRERLEGFRQLKDALGPTADYFVTPVLGRSAGGPGRSPVSRAVTSKLRVES